MTNPSPSAMFYKRGGEGLKRKYSHSLIKVYKYLPSMIMSFMQASYAIPREFLIKLQTELNLIQQLVLAYTKK